MGRKRMWLALSRGRKRKLIRLPFKEDLMARHCGLPRLHQLRGFNPGKQGRSMLRPYGPGAMTENLAPYCDGTGRGDCAY